MHAEAVAVLVRSVGWQWIGKTDGVEFIRRLLGRIGLLAGNLGGNFARRKKHVDDLKRNGHGRGWHTGNGILTKRKGKQAQ